MPYVYVYCHLTVYFLFLLTCLKDVIILTSFIFNGKTLTMLTKQLYDYLFECRGRFKMHKTTFDMFIHQQMLLVVVHILLLLLKQPPPPPHRSTVVFCVLKHTELRNIFKEWEKLSAYISIAILIP